MSCSPAPREMRRPSPRNWLRALVAAYFTEPKLEITMIFVTCVACGLSELGEAVRQGPEAWHLQPCLSGARSQAQGERPVHDSLPVTPGGAQGNHVVACPRVSPRGASGVCKLMEMFRVLVAVVTDTQLCLFAQTPIVRLKWVDFIPCKLDFRKKFGASFPACHGAAHRFRRGRL